MGTNSFILPHKPVDGVSEIFRNLVQLEAFLVPFSQILPGEKLDCVCSDIIDSVLRSHDGDRGAVDTITIFRLFLSQSFL